LTGRSELGIFGPCLDDCGLPAVDMYTTCSIIAGCQRWICIPRAQSGRGAEADFRQAAGLRGLRGGDRPGQGADTDAALGVVRDEQSLAFRPLAARRRRPVGVHALADGHPHPALARGASHVGNRPTPQTEAELESLRRSVTRSAPFGDASWQQRTAKRLNLQSTLRPRGRPWPSQDKSK